MTNMSHEDREPVVTIFVATINTAHATELCIRSLDRYTSLAHRTTVGDCGSTDRTLPMLMRQLRANRVQDVELAPCGRDHGSWIDHWIETCQTDYAAIVDSDVEILDGAWLETLIETATRTRATCVAAELLPERENYVDAYGYNRRLSRRPSPWMMLLNVPEARNMPSFEIHLARRSKCSRGSAELRYRGEISRGRRSSWAPRPRSPCCVQEPLPALWRLVLDQGPKGQA